MKMPQDSVAFFFPFLIFVVSASFVVYQTQSSFLSSVPVLAIPVSSCLVMELAFANQQIICQFLFSSLYFQVAFSKILFSKGLI